MHHLPAHAQQGIARQASHLRTRHNGYATVIVGKGLLAQAFEPMFGNDPDVVVFASGVSNSLETHAAAFARERALLSRYLDAAPRRLVYFGSCGVIASTEGHTPYMEHKKTMEALVLASPGGLVLRLPQVVGPTNNAHTLPNYLRDRILAGEHFTVWEHAERNLIDIEDVARIGFLIATELPVHRSNTVNIAAAQSVSVPAIVGMFERILAKQANYSLLPQGDPLPIDTAIAVQMGARLGIDLGSGYIESVIRKYYAVH
jgi:hypothetical protein